MPNQSHDKEIELSPRHWKTYTPENLMSSHAAKQCIKNGIPYKGVITTEEAKDYVTARKQLVTVTSRHDDKSRFFFTTDHCFGVYVMPDDFVPCTTQFPTYVTPRPGCEDGVVDTVEKYLSVFKEDATQITSIEELCEYLNTRS
jgi:hypothetical protein